MAPPAQLVAIAGTGGSEPLFVALVFLHAVSALAGFGSIGFAGTYASRAVQIQSSAVVWGAAVPLTAGGQSIDPGAQEVSADSGPGQAADPEVEELVRYFERPARFWKAVLAVPVLGVLALAAEPGGKGFDHIWPISALLVWSVAAIVVTSMVVPCLNEMKAILAQLNGVGGAVATSGAVVLGPAARAALARAGRLAGRGAALCDVLFFAALALMIWRP